MKRNSREIAGTLLGQARLCVRETYNKPGMNDLFALALAKQEEWPLLTGNKDLREAAGREEVIVNGTLWLMQRLFDNNLLDLGQVEIAYQRMKEDGRRLPWVEVERQLKKLKKELV